MTPLRTLGLLLTLVAASVLPALGSVFAAPIVVVYPLTFPGAVSGNEAGSDVSIVLAQKIAEGGGVTVTPYIPGTPRAQYLEAAVSEKADYYVTGFLQTIGDDVSMIVQVVSTHSGSVVFSTTATIHTFGDAALQAEPLREAILRHAGRGLAQLDTPAQSNASPSSAPTNGPGVNLTQALRKRRKATPLPSSSPTDNAGLTPVSEFVRPVASASPVLPSPLTAASAAIVKGTQVAIATSAASPSESPTALRALPSESTAMVIDPRGGESAGSLEDLATDLLIALRRSGIRAARLPIAADDLRKNAASVCRANPGAQRFYAPSLVLGYDDAASAVARLSVDAIDCTGATVATRAASGVANLRGGFPFAIRRAAEKMVPLLSGV